MRFLLVIVGIGFLIFVHELGHFLVAKLVGIRVHAFSIGFGPKLFGFRFGETDYRVSLFPLGGYVKMAGDSPEDSDVLDERDFRAKSVGQRAAVISAGVVMNALFGFLIFALAFSLGVPFDVPEVGAVRRGGAAWEAGVPEGARILAVNGNRVYDFADVSTETALARRSTGVVLTLREGDGKPFDLRLHPRKNPSTGFLEIGVYRPFGPIDLGSVQEGASAGESGLREGDVLLEIEDVPVTPLSLDRFVNTHSIEDPEDEGARFLRLRVRRGERIEEVRYEPEWVPHYRIGIRPAGNRVLGIREPGLEPGIDLRRDDRILQVGEARVWSEEDLASALESIPVGSPVSALLVRDGVERSVTWALAGGAARERFLSRIAVGDDRETNRIRVIPGEAAESAGLRDGDRIVSLAGKAMDDFLDILGVMSEYEGRGELPLEYVRDGVPVRVDLVPRKFFFPRLRFPLQYKVEVLRVGSVARAVSLGFQRALYTAKQVYVMLDRMLFRRTVSTKNIGGIITITVVSFKFAESGFAKLLYFLALLSVNLAIINLLPIPILDGGQLLFLLIEKIKGSPVNEKVMQYAQIIGVAVLVLIVLYVTYNDVERLFRIR